MPVSGRRLMLSADADADAADAAVEDPLEDFMDVLEGASLSMEEAAQLAEEELVKSLIADGTVPADFEARFERVISRVDQTRQRIAEAVHGVEAATRDPLDQVNDTLKRLVDTGQLLERPYFLKSIGWTRQALSKAVNEKRLFFVQVAKERAFPSFYLDPRYERKQLEVVTKLLGDLSGGGKWLFFTTPKGSLAKAMEDSAGAPMSGTARTPLQALHAGDVEAVKRAAVGATQR